jgi:predicted DsbA family dithiol-disulfide isomerase
MVLHRATPDRRGAADCLEFRFDIARSGSTFDAHRIVHFAEAHGLHDVMKERLLRAYFTEGELISDHQTLARLAAEIGLPEHQTRETLDGEPYAEHVRRRAHGNPARDQRSAHVRDRSRARCLRRSPT